MFDGVPDQFHQFIAASRASLPIPLSLPLHGGPSPSPPPPQQQPPPPPQAFPSFDHAYHLQHVPPPPPPPQHHHHQKKEELLLQSSISSSCNNNNNNNRMMLLERVGSMPDPEDPWSNDEVLALLRIRSGMETWFPDFTYWEHVSRKLAEVGFKRSAEKCKEKFEEESRHLNNLSFNKSYRFFTELDELYHHGDENENNNKNNNNNTQVSTQKNLNIQKQHEEDKEEGKRTIMEVEDVAATVTTNNNNNEEEEEEVVKKPSTSNNSNDNDISNNSKKRKRKNKHNNKFEMVKDFCEAIVKKMMDLQEELHNKFMEDMVKRDEEMIAREEAWKHQEMDRLNKEIELRVKEQAIAKDRQDMLIDFLNNFTPSSLFHHHHHQNMGKMIEDFLKTSCPNNNLSPQNPSSCPPLPTQQKRKKKRKNDDAAPVIVAPSSSSETQSQRDEKRSSLVQSQSPAMMAAAEAKTTSSSTTPSMTNNIQVINPNSYFTKVVLDHQSTPTRPPPLMNITTTTTTTTTPTSSSLYKVSEDAGKRWPRDEVLALINLRCSLINSNDTTNTTSNNNNGDDNKSLEGEGRGGGRGGGRKCPLWERISQGMQQLGYKRSAKRCKEKWENINKYFRKTKHNNKKRSLDSRTCPYYHHLSSLYTQGVLVVPTDASTAAATTTTTSPPMDRCSNPSGDLNVTAATVTPNMQGFNLDDRA